MVLLSRMRQSSEGRGASYENYGVVKVKKTESNGLVCKLLKTLQIIIATETSLTISFLLCCQITDVDI